ncbi:MAG: glycogen synthase, partial [Acidobacteriota bacterium]
MPTLKICFVASELAPFAKVGGLADVSAALGRYLFEKGHDLRLFIPLYASIDVQRFGLMPVDFIQNIPLPLGPRPYSFSLYTALLPRTGLWVYFVHCPALYDRPDLYTVDSDEHLRFALLSRAVFECCQRMGWEPHVLHCNDWQTALMPLFKRTFYAWDRVFDHTRTVLTIHNLGYQGIFGADAAGDLGLGFHSHLLDQDDLRSGVVNFLKTGLLYADALTTVSPTYAREIQRDGLGMGLQHLLRARADRLFGILNGVDYGEWSPEVDPLIPSNYSRRAWAAKEKNKKALLESAGLPYNQRVPVMGLISRLVAQKGIDLLFDPLPEALQERDLQLVVLGSGEWRFESFFKALRERFPKQVAFLPGFNEPLSHLVEAGSDLYLMPSLYEP